MTGEWPALTVHHKNLDRSDDRWENLREATWQQNSINKGANKNNKLGVKGVCLGGGGKYRASIAPNRKQIRLGEFNTIEEASRAYEEAAKRCLANSPASNRGKCSCAELHKYLSSHYFQDNI